VYALALRELGELPGDRCVTAYCYLGGDAPEIDPFDWGSDDLDRQRRTLETVLAALDRSEFDRRCGLPTCRTCRGT
jgi:hypothetical protein